MTSRLLWQDNGHGMDYEERFDQFLSQQLYIFLVINILSMLVTFVKLQVTGEALQEVGLQGRNAIQKGHQALGMVSHLQK